MSINNVVIQVLRRNLKQALKHRQLRESEDLINQLKLEDPLSLETRGLELEFLIAKQRWQEARTLTDQLLHLYPESARVHFLSGRLSYRHKQYDAALGFFEESNRLHAHWLTRRWLGKTFTQIGNFEYAESILLSILDGHIIINLDLAWLYERNNQQIRALSHVERYLKIRPDDPFAKTQELRLKAQTLEPQTLSNDVALLLELDEDIPAAMLPAYLNHLLESGQAKSARRFLSKYESRLEPDTATSLGWICYKLQAYDLAMNLFIQGLAYKSGDVKYLSALESSARHCNRVEELIPHYETEAEQERRLYGRIKRLRKDLEK